MGRFKSGVGYGEITESSARYICRETLPLTQRRRKIVLAWLTLTGDRKGWQAEEQRQQPPRSSRESLARTSSDDR